MTSSLNKHVLGPADFTRERQLLSSGKGPVAGIDEAGRGPLAGPVSAAAVILDPAAIPDGLADSKTLSPAMRERLFTDVLRSAMAVGVGLASAAEIDRVNIRQATFLAMRRACRALSIQPAFVLIDGRDIPPDLPCQAHALIKGDALCLSIAAASIVAKVTRDRLMVQLAKRHPEYGFDKHMGYPTAAHRAALNACGPSLFHRLTFGAAKK